MGTSWAVGSATMLALAAAAIAIGGGTHASEVWFVAFGIVPLLAVWAYAIAMGAHGSRTALVALAGLATAGVTAAFALEWRATAIHSSAPLGAALAIVTAIVGALTLWAIVDEIRARRGRVHILTVIGLQLPILLTAACLYSAVLLSALSGNP